jgi:hypothetical protein
MFDCLFTPCLDNFHCHLRIMSDCTPFVIADPPMPSPIMMSPLFRWTNLWLLASVNYTIWLFLKMFFAYRSTWKHISGLDYLKGCETHQCPYWTKECQWLRHSSLHFRIGQNKKTPKLLTSYLNWKASLMLTSYSVCDLYHLVYLFN